jgi:hypothetical protein
MTHGDPTTECTEESEQVTNERQTTRARPTAECSQQSEPASNVRQSTSRLGKNKCNV